jgi:large subunit ribosomal protein L18
MLINKTKLNRSKKRVMRHARVRKDVKGTHARPRLAVFRSNQQIYAQIIDDTKGHTVAAASSMEKEIKAAVKDKRALEIAFMVGKHLAQRAKKAGISLVVFDRGGYIYHGRVKALAEGARQGGLQF